MNVLSLLKTLYPQIDPPVDSVGYTGEKVAIRLGSPCSECSNDELLLIQAPLRHPLLHITHDYTVAGYTYPKSSRYRMEEISVDKFFVDALKREAETGWIDIYDVTPEDDETDYNEGNRLLDELALTDPAWEDKFGDCDKGQIVVIHFGYVDYRQEDKTAHDSQGVTISSTNPILRKYLTWKVFKSVKSSNQRHIWLEGPPSDPEPDTTA